MRAVIAEDERLIAMGLDMMLKNLGVEVLACCASGESCLEAVRQEQPDIIFMDIHMASQHDGIEAAMQIKKHADSAIIFTTAYDDPETRQLASSVEHVAFLVKPFRELDIKNIVERIRAQRNSVT